jgi:uncharacterized membrane protein YkvA (DUF1232 family)
MTALSNRGGSPVRSKMPLRVRVLWLDGSGARTPSASACGAVARMLPGQSTGMNGGAMTEMLTAKLEERIDDGTRQRVHDRVAESTAERVPESTAPMPTRALSRFLEAGVGKRLGHLTLVKLASHQTQVTEALRELPNRMHLVANQTKLMMELIDDFRAGKYRQVPWHALAIAAAAILYVASPADLLPDVLAGLGFLDDTAVAAMAARAVRKDLKAYCAYKGYDVHEYFAAG